MFNQYNNSTNLGFKLINIGQFGKEYDINYNLYLLDFWLMPNVKDEVTEIPNDLLLGEVVLINNVEHLNHNYLVIFINKYHLIKPIENMRINIKNKQLLFKDNIWIEHTEN
jgi:hypothetical protein